MSLVKISIENLEGNDKKLHEIDKSKSLEDNIKSVCELFEKPTQTTVYGLQLISTNDGKFIHSYISEDNFDDIKDGYFLKLVYSVKHYSERIFDHLQDDFKAKSFEDLLNLSIEPEFIKEIVRTEKHFLLIDLFTTTELNDRETTACLITIVHLFQKSFINDISSEFLHKVVSIIKSKSQTEPAKYALSVLHKILLHRESSFVQWKEEIIRQVPISDLTDFIQSKNPFDLQFGALLVINALIKCCKGEKRYLLIKEINQRKNRELIYKHIIQGGDIDKNMAHELYVYQTYCLSTYSEVLNSTLNLNETDFFERGEFEIQDDDVRRMTILMDFEDNLPRNKNVSIENILECDENMRISLASMSSRYSEDSSGRSVREVTSVVNDPVEYENFSISVLTLEALRHYKKYHYKNFWQSQIEEKVYEPGIFFTSERIIKLLAKILHIGIEPDRNSTLYQPIVFYCSSKTPFFEELFSRTMWLLSKTRREMKASTLQDYEKVIRVLEQQVRLVLEEKPMDFKRLTEKMANITYDTVMKQWQKKKEEQMNNFIETSPSIQILKEQYTKRNEVLVFEQRMTYLETGTLFPRIIEKKISGNFVAKLSNTRRELILYEYNPNTKYRGETKTYPIPNITHIVEGKACPHVINNAVKEPYLAFSIIINNSEYINFKAHDKKMASYWLDALNLLLGKDNRSQVYKNELSQLVKMDLVLHLIELQNVTLPKKAPPVPPLPKELKPSIPPKPRISLKKI